MKYYRLKMNERDFGKMPQVIQINEFECVALALDDAIIPATAVEITEEDFNVFKPKITQKPSLEEKVDALGKMVTQLMLK